MEFREKIRRLVGMQNKSELSRRAGLPDTALDAVINKGREPLASNAIRLARALGVPSDWLFDDAKDWPPPKELGAESLTQAQLIEELARRRELIRTDMRAIASHLPNEKLVHLERVSMLRPTNDAQALELEATMTLLFRVEMLSRMLLWLDPDEAHPPTVAQSAEQILERFAHLQGEFNAFLRKRISGSLGTPAMSRAGKDIMSLPRYDMNGGTFPDNSEKSSETASDGTEIKTTFPGARRGKKTTSKKT